MFGAVKVGMAMMGGTSLMYTFLLYMYHSSPFETAGYGQNEIDQENLETTPFSITRTSCRKFVMLLGKRLMKYLNGCIKTVKEEHPEEKGLDTYFQCAMKCAMHKIKMVDDNYLFSNETFITFTQTHVPKRFYPMVHQIMGQCVGTYTKIITGKDDPYCKTYGDFIKCIQDDLAVHCD